MTETSKQDTQATTQKRLYLVDGSSFIFRAYHSLPPMTRPDGTPVNAVLGFCNMLLRVMDNHCDAIAVIFDPKGGTFRNEIYPQYKANRDEPPEDLRPQFSLVRDATRAFNVACIEQPGFEADDLIAAYAKHATADGYETVIVSSDKDLMQLVNPQVWMWDTMKNREIKAPEVFEKFGVGPEKVIDVQSLAGDSVDNIPGVPGIGVKTAALLINEFGDLDTLLEQAHTIKQNKRRESLLEFANQARISRDLVALNDKVDLPVPISGLTRQQYKIEDLGPFLLENGFRSVINRLQLPLGNALLAEHSPTSNQKIEVDYELVTDVGTLEKWIAASYAAGKIAVDTETTGLDQMQSDLVGVCLATEAGKACYIPLGHRASEGLALEGDGPEQIPMQTALDLLRPLLEDPAVLKIGQNLKYDMGILHRYNIELHPIDDTMLLSYVLDAGLHNHNMDELARIFLDYETIKFSDIAGKGKAQLTFDLIPLDKALYYAAEDADITLRLYNVLKPRLPLEKQTTLYETIERPLVQVLSQMERKGIVVDRTQLKRMSQNFAVRSAELEKEAHELAGEVFNVASPKQLGEILFDKMGIPGGKRSKKTGAYSTGADVLEGLAAQGHELPKKIMENRQLQKLKSTYTDALQEQINPDTGRVHTSYSMTGASTGRLSSTDPNLQNIPIRTSEGRKIREAFIAEKGKTLLSVDYSQIELRLTAHIADEQALKQAFHDGLDIHAMTAAQVFGVPIEGMDPMVRRQAKAINFGIIYGISAFGLANNLGIPQGEARDFIHAYFERFPGIKSYMERTKEEAREAGFVTTLFGRRIHVPGYKDKNPAMRSFADRQAINAPIQGTAADIMKRAMIRVPPALAAANLSADTLLSVHDELLFELPPEEMEETIKVVKQVMETAHQPAIDISVPLVADAGSGQSWAEAH